MLCITHAISWLILNRISTATNFCCSRHHAPYGASNFVYSVQACSDYIHLTSGFYSVMVSELRRLWVRTAVSYIETTTAALSHWLTHLMLNYSLHPIFTLLHSERGAVVSKTVSAAPDAAPFCSSN
jgi:hypothetical protein